MRLKEGLVVVTILGLLIPLGCSRPGPPPPPPHRPPPEALAARRDVVTLKVVERAFEPRHLVLKVGRPVTISVTNTTDQAHNITIKDPQGHRVVDRKVPVGEAVSIPFAPTTPGTYIFYCKYALHRTFGEEGTLEVR